MSILPDIVDGKLTEAKKEPKLYTPPKTHGLKREEERLADLNNLGRKEVAEDFSDSPVLR